MKLEDQVCSLELAKRLKELGVPQQSLFWWQACPDGMTCLHEKRLEYGYQKDHEKNAYSAFTVAELGEMLPCDIVSGKTPNGWWKGEKYTCIDFIEHAASFYHKDETKKKKPEIHEDTEADARAKMLIYLLENKIITL